METSPTRLKNYRTNPADCEINDWIQAYAVNWDRSESTHTMPAPGLASSNESWTFLRDETNHMEPWSKLPVWIRVS